MNRYLETGAMSFKDAFRLFRFSVLYGYDNQLIKLLSDPKQLSNDKTQEEVFNMLQEINKFNAMVEKNREKILRIDFLEIYMDNRNDKMAKSIIKEYPTFPATNIRSVLLLAECYGKLAELVLALCRINEEQLK